MQRRAATTGRPSCAARRATQPAVRPVPLPPERLRCRGLARTRSWCRDGKRGLAIGYATRGIRTSAVAPGIVRTPSNPPDTHGTLDLLQPMGRPGDVDDIVGALPCLERGGFVTGEVKEFRLWRVYDSISRVSGHGNIYPESGGGHEDVDSSASPAHEAAFHRWNDALTQNYNAAHTNAQFQGAPDARTPVASMSRYPLYRTSQQNPDDVLRPGGELQSRTASVNPNDTRSGWDLSRHQMGMPSQYVAMTTSLPAAQELSRPFRGNHVFATDPQPHGRYLNDHSSTDAAPQGGTGNALTDAVPFRGTEEALRQHEVAVPGSVPTPAVRGVVPVNLSTGQLEFAHLRTDPHYQAPTKAERTATTGCRAKAAQSRCHSRC